MAENNKRRKVRSESMALDAMHIIIGIAVVVMAVISFLDTEVYVPLSGDIFPGGSFKSGHRKILAVPDKTGEAEKNGGGVPDGVRNDPADLYIFKRNEYLVEVMR